MRKRQKRLRSPEPGRWRTYSMMFICGAVLVAGFFLAARQHFASMDYGMRNSRLRKQIDDLEAEKRRLLLARETSLSPLAIKKAAKKTGLIAPEDAPALAQVASATKEKAVPPNAPTSAPKPAIVKTASVAAVTPAMNADYVRPERIVKQVKKALGAN
jgi:hypothetical protein